MESGRFKLPLFFLRHGCRCTLLGMPNKHDASYWIKKLDLQPHPEGGYFRQTYKSDLTIAREGLPGEFGGSRAAATAIYFLLTGENFSAFHRLRSDETWHFYAGAPVMVHVMEPGGSYSMVLLGSDAQAGQSFQAVVRAGCWFASHVEDWKSWALVGCTVAPGFEFEDFEMGKRVALQRDFPDQSRVIQKLTRG
jgi:uncharacterized protein